MASCAWVTALTLEVGWCATSRRCRAEPGKGRLRRRRPAPRRRRSGTSRSAPAAAVPAQVCGVIGSGISCLGSALISVYSLPLFDSCTAIGRAEGLLKAVRNTTTRGSPLMGARRVRETDELLIHGQRFRTSGSIEPRRRPAPVDGSFAAPAGGADRQRGGAARDRGCRRLADLRDGSSSSKPPAQTVSPIEPIALSASGLQTLTATLNKVHGQPIYWAGAKAGTSTSCAGRRTATSTSATCRGT